MKLFNEKTRDLLLVVLGTFLFSVGVNVFFEPQNLLTGGLTGVSILVSELIYRFFSLRLPIGPVYFFIEIPLAYIAYKVMGVEFIKKTIIGSLLTSFWLSATAYLPAIQTDLILATLFGGAITGVGLGLVFRGKATTGGSDIIVAMLHKKFEFLSISNLLFALDAVVIAGGLFFYGPEKAMYSIVAIFVSSKIINTILVGTTYCRVVFVVSDKTDEVSRALMYELNRGVTSLNGMGMYTKKDKQVLFCAIAQREITLVREIVKKADPNAFLMVTDAREVLGEGFENFI